MSSQLELGELISVHVGEAVEYAALIPPGYNGTDVLPLCLFLLGGGGSRENLVQSQPLFDSWWAQGVIPPMVVATPSPGMSFYLEQTHGIRWESFLADEFISHLHGRFAVSRDAQKIAITGVSGGGYGALKTAFRHPDRFCAVAAMQPMLEPGFTVAEIGARNTLHHSAGGPPELIGPSRDPAAFEYNNPANIARENANAIRDAGLAISIEVGDDDFLNAHDGTEFLHRVLWDLDISHDYHLIRGADHGGPTLRPRMRNMLAAAGNALCPKPVAEVEPTSPSSSAFIRAMRERFEPLRREAAASDPATNRRFGKL